MANEPRCPKCGKTIIHCSVKDVENQGYQINTYEEGTCDICGTAYMWRCTYKYEGCGTVIEIKKSDK